VSVSTYLCNPIGDIAVDPTSGRLVTTQVVMSPDGSEIYIVCRDGISVICVSDRRVFERIAIGARPSCVATSAATGQLYVADHAGNVTTLPAVTPVLQAAG
jgi:DNA-binding beta-propeller fold protein YncE